MDKNTKEFKNPLHQHLWRGYINLFPFELTTAWIEDEELLESCRQLYHYITDAYDDILENPNEYEINPNECGTFGGEKTNFHYNILANPLRRSYGSFLEHAEIKANDCLIIDTPVYDKFIKNVKNKKYNGVKIFTEEGIFEKLYSALSRSGMIIERDEIKTIIRNEKYPQMFLAADLLLQAGLRYYSRTKRTPQFFNLLDFREISGEKRKWDVEDIIGGWYDNQKELVYKFIDYVSQKIKLSKKCEIWYYRTAYFKYKKRDLFFVRWGKSYAFDMGLHVIPPNTDDFFIFENEINKLPNREEIKEFYYNHILLCGFCAQRCIKTNAYKKEWRFFGKPLPKLIKSCEQCVIITEFNETNYNYFKTLIDIYIDIYCK